MSTKMRLDVLASGGGTNLQSIIDRCHDGSLDAEIAVVISNNPDAGALDRAARAGILSQCINHREFPSREDFDTAVVKALREAGVELVVLAGFMRMIKTAMLEAYNGKILNIHPSLLPAFPGLASWKQALDYGVTIAGCTVHLIDAGMDTGPIIVQRSVPVLDDDTPDGPPRQRPAPDRARCRR